MANFDSGSPLFIEKKDLGSVIYSYQIDQITESNDDIVFQAIAAAETEIRSYFIANNKREWRDGRLRYDVSKIFSSRGNERNPLLVSHTVTIAKWYIVELCNADIIYEHAKERYDRAISWLKQLAKGDISLDTLPLLDEVQDENESTNRTTSFIAGSRNKFNHE